MIDVTCNSKTEYNLNAMSSMTSPSHTMKMASKSITTYDRLDQHSD